MDNIVATESKHDETSTDNNNQSTTTTTTEDVNHQYAQSDYECIFDNEYEIIGYKLCSYQQIDAKTESYQTIKNKIPPALPPKPTNLMKLQHVLQTTNDKYITFFNDSNVTQKSEPDYCSIIDINDRVELSPVVSTDNTVIAEDSATDITDDLFSDIPKLPNVAAILSPKKCIDQRLQQDSPYLNNKPVPPIKPPNNFLLKNSYHPHTVPNKTNRITDSIRIKEMSTPCFIKTFEDKVQIHSEFDWYNLDAEYGKDFKHT